MKNKALFWTATTCLGCFLALILAVLLIDVQAVGPQGSEIGLATVNVSVHAALGISETWDKATDFLAAFVILVAALLAGLGVYQLIKRKSIKKVDADLLWLCGFSAFVVLAYVLFEALAINCRPVLTEEGLEASFPSTHTMFSVFVMGAAAYQSKKRLHNPVLKKAGVILSVLVASVISAGRLFAGVHWLTDVLGGALFGAACACAYTYLAHRTENSSVQTAD